MSAAAAARGPLVVAIDGPSGVGKSTAARRLARRLGVPYLDTGAMYRAIALAALDAGVDPGDREAVAALAAKVDLRLEPRGEGMAVLLAGEPAGERLRTPEAGSASSVVAAYPEVRRRLVALQRESGTAYGGVLEGRDIGTRVFPDTPHKFFLTADPEIRHRRRFEQLQGSGRPASLEAVVGEIEDRDRRDAARSESPLVCDGSYTVIDTSALSADEVVERIAAAVRRCQERPDAG